MGYCVIKKMLLVWYRPVSHALAMVLGDVDCVRQFRTLQQFPGCSLALFLSTVVGPPHKFVPVCAAGAFQMGQVLFFLDVLCSKDQAHSAAPGLPIVQGRTQVYDMCIVPPLSGGQTSTRRPAYKVSCTGYKCKQGVVAAARSRTNTIVIGDSGLWSLKIHPLARSTRFHFVQNTLGPVTCTPMS